MDQPPELAKDPGKLRLACGPVGKQSALLAIQNSIRLQQGRHDLQGRRCCQLGEAQQGDPQGVGAGVQGPQRVMVEFALVGPPETLALRSSRQQYQASALVAPKQGPGLMQHRLVVEAPLALQGHHNGEAP